MRHLLNDWPSLRKVFSKKKLFLFLDFDGTLAPIARKPGLVKVPTVIRRVLRDLSRRPGCRVAIVSGRELKDVRRLIGLPDLTYVGNHGSEFSGPGYTFSPVRSADVRKKIFQILTLWRKEVGTIPGVLIEDKGMTASAHYRLVAAGRQKTVRQKVLAVFLKWPGRRDFILRRGKKVLEICPAASWHKGRAVLWLRKRWLGRGRAVDALSIYIGDDVTDEDAFHALRGKGITVRVGRGRKTKADLFLKDTREVAMFLLQLLALRKA